MDRRELLGWMGAGAAGAFAAGTNAIQAAEDQKNEDQEPRPAQQRGLAMKTEGTPEELRSIDEFHKKQAQAFKDHDHHAWANAFTDDATMFFPNPFDILHTKEQIRPWIEGHINRQYYDLKIHETVVSGTMAYECGTFSGWTLSRAGRKIEQSGVLLRILRKQRALV